MEKSEALKIIDKHKNALVNPVDMLLWTYLRVIISQVSDVAWDDAWTKAEEILSK